MSQSVLTVPTVAARHRVRPFLLPSLALFALALVLIVMPLLTTTAVSGAWWRNVEPFAGLALAIAAGVMARIGAHRLPDVTPPLADVTGAVGWASGADQLRRRPL